MSTGTTKRELEKVKLEGKRVALHHDSDSASETESDVTELAEGEDEPDYFPDVIKWARYRDSREDRPEDGRKGWHYGVMWTGYLKSQSDTEEFYECFALDDEGRNELLTDFWNAVGRPLRLGKDGKTLKEPKGKLGDKLFPPDALLERWISSARPRRSFKRYKIRESKLWSVPQKKILKRDSDYYYYRKIKAKQAKQRALELKQSGGGTASSPATPATATPVDSEIEESDSKKAVPKKAIFGSSSLSTLPDDLGAKPKSQTKTKIKASSSTSGVSAGKGKGKAKEEDPALKSLFSDEEGDEVVAIESDKKRKPKDDTPKPSADRSRGPSPPKKQRSPSKPDAVPRVHDTKATTKSSQPPSTHSVLSGSMSAPARIGPKEPLFLSSEATSPIDTFGEPLPGIFGPPQQAEKTVETKPRISVSPMPLDQPEPAKAPSPAPVITAPVPAPKEPTPPVAAMEAPAKQSQTVSAPTTSLSVDSPPKPSASAQPTSRSLVQTEKVPTPPSTGPSSAIATKMTQTAPATPPPEGESQTNDRIASAPVPAAPQQTAGEPHPPQSPQTTTEVASATEADTTAPAAPVPDSNGQEAPLDQSEDMDMDVDPPSPAPPANKLVPPILEVHPATDATMPPSPGRESPIATSPPSLPPSSPPPEPPTLSPPRYGHSDSAGQANPPSKPVSSTKPTGSTSLSPKLETSPTKPHVPPSERPKYVQPSRVKIMTDVVDPEAEAKMQKMAARKGSHPSPSHPSLPGRPSTIVPPTGSKQARPPKPGPPRSLPSPLAPTHYSSSTSAPTSAPIQPRTWGAQPPTGPASNQSRPPASYGGYGGGPLPDQRDMYKTTHGQAPWEQRQQNGGMTPLQSPYNPSPTWGGASPLLPTDRWTPNSAPLSYGLNASPQWTSNSYNGPQFPPGFPSAPLQSPQYPAPPQAVDPRGASPMGRSAFSAGGQTPMPAGSDPRRPSMPPPTPLQAPRSPEGAGSTASGSRRIDTLGKVVLRLGTQETTFPALIASRGAMPDQQPDGDAVLAQVLGTGTRQEVTLTMETVDLSLVHWQMSMGAKVVQWAKLGSPPSEAQGRWDSLKRSSVEQGKTWAAFTELFGPDHAVNAHYALILTAAKNVEAAITGPGLGLGPWANVLEAGVALAVLSMPLTSTPPPSLPNPVRPELSEVDLKPKVEIISGQPHVLASYGLFPRYFASLAGRPAVTYPNKDNACDLLHKQTEHEFTGNGVLPYDPQTYPEHVLFKNNQMPRATRASTTRNTVNRRTQFCAVGPAMHLAPSQWQLTEIWKTGGVVTFSPTFILRHPEKMHEIMGTIRTAPNWAAYVIPEVLQWAEASWKIPARCPKPHRAFAVLTKALFLDHKLLSVSGSKASSGGGLAVSTCPPHVSNTDKCARWLQWLAQVTAAEDYHQLIKLCFEYTDPSRAKVGAMDMDVDADSAELNLVDIETKQMEDLAAMRFRPDLLPYRRYVHIGEVSFGAEKKNKLAAGIECIEADSFAAVLSGAI